MGCGSLVVPPLPLAGEGRGEGGISVGDEGAQAPPSSALRAPSPASGRRVEHHFNSAKKSCTRFRPSLSSAGLHVYEMRIARGSPNAEPGTQATPFASSNALQKSTSFAIAVVPCFLPKATEMS